MFNYHCLNPISDVGLEEFTEEYVPVSGPEKADALLVRSAVMHEMEFGKELKAIAGRGQVLTISPWTGVPRKGSWSSTHREPTPTGSRNW